MSIDTKLSIDQWVQIIYSAGLGVAKLFELAKKDGYDPADIQRAVAQLTTYWPDPLEGEPPIDPPPVSIYEVWYDQPPAAAPYEAGDILWVQKTERWRYIVLRPEAVTAGPHTSRFAVKLVNAWSMYLGDPPVDDPVDPPADPVDPTDPHPPPVAPPYRTPLGANPLVSNPWLFPNGCHVWRGMISGEIEYMVAPIDGGMVWPGAEEIGVIGMG